MAESYRGRRAALATRHGKEQVITPEMMAHAGLGLVVPSGLDTDQLGTFTGEIPRLAPMRETARRKAIMGMDATGLPLGIASEGSFGPHPSIPFLAAARELLIFIDAERGLEIVEEQLSPETNFAAIDLAADADLDGFLHRIGFPLHAVILRSDAGLVKAIASRSQLDEALRQAQGAMRLETDMRAHLNPTRMGEIGKLAERLARRIATPCPACAAPGFGVVRAGRGLPCAECGTPTDLIRILINGCSLCGYELEQPRPDGQTSAAPSHCPECNP